VQTEKVADLWVAPVDQPAEARQITSGSTLRDGADGLAWTPDGRIVYTSSGSGSLELWVTNAMERVPPIDRGSKRGGFPARLPGWRAILFTSLRATGTFTSGRWTRMGALSSR